MEVGNKKCCFHGAVFLSGAGAQRVSLQNRGQPGVTLEKGGQRGSSPGAIIRKSKDTITLKNGSAFSKLAPSPLLRGEGTRVSRNLCVGEGRLCWEEWLLGHLCESL